MEHVMRALHHWLATNNIEAEGVRLIIEFQDRRTAGHAEACTKRDMEPILSTFGSVGKIETMMGIGLSLTYRQK